MQLKHIIAISLLSLPLIANATEISITNKSNKSGTAKLVSQNVCSSGIAGDAGIIKPGQTLKIPQMVFDLFCTGESCAVEIFMTPDCSGNAMASATINQRNGILAVNNLDPSHYKITYNNKSATLEEKTGVSSFGSFSF